jgi:hypothetical protein
LGQARALLKRLRVHERDGALPTNPRFRRMVRRRRKRERHVDDTPAFDAYEAALKAIRGIKPPGGLTLEQLHEFWIWVEVHAYYERKTNLCHMSGEFNVDYFQSDIRKWIVGEYHKAQDAEFRTKHAAER